MTLRIDVEKIDINIPNINESKNKFRIRYIDSRDNFFYCMFIHEILLDIDFEVIICLFIKKEKGFVVARTNQNCEIKLTVKQKLLRILKYFSLTFQRSLETISFKT